MKRRNLFWFFNIGNRLLCSISQKQIILNYKQNPCSSFIYSYIRIKIYILTVPVRVEFVGINGTILRLQFSVQNQRRKIRRLLLKHWRCVRAEHKVWALIKADMSHRLFMQSTLILFTSQLSQSHSTPSPLAISAPLYFTFTAYPTFFLLNWNFSVE